MTTTTLLPRAPPDLQNPTASTTTTRHRPFSTSLVRRLPRGASERSSRLDKKTRNSSLRVGGTSRRPSPSSGAARAPGSGGDARVPDSDSDLVVVRNSTRTRRVSKLRRNGITTQAKASPAHAVRSSTRRPRALRPILIPPTFPPSLLSKTNPPISEPYQDLSEWRGDDDDKATKTDAGPSTTLELSGLPSNTLKTDIRYVFQRLGEIRRVFVRGSRAEVMFADVDSVKRALHAYAERPFYVQGQEIAVFRKPSNADSAGVSDLFPGPFRMRRERDDDDGSDSSIFVANFPAGTTHEELSGVFTPLGRYERFVMRPGSKYAHFVYSSDDRVEYILRVHQRVPITFRGQSLRIERSRSTPHSVSAEEEEEFREVAKPHDSATSSALVEELKKTVPGWKGTCEPSRVLWIGRLPHDISRKSLENFWSRLGCVVEVRVSASGFAHVEFASTEDATRAVRQGVPHGFRYEKRLLDVDFAPWVFFVGPIYRCVYISGWSPSHGRNGLLRWASDIPDIVGAIVLPPFRGEKRSSPRGAFLYFRSTGAARAGFRALNGRKGPSGSETLHLTLSRRSAVHDDRLWRWAYMEESGEDDSCFEHEWGGLGFGTGQEYDYESESSSPVRQFGEGRQAEPGTRGGRLRIWKDPAWRRERRDVGEDTTFSHSLWADASDGGEEFEGEEDPRVLRVEVERKVEEGQQVAQRAFFRRQSRRQPPKTGDP